MKIRTDFVTNSSSSSFITFGINSEELYKYLKDLKDNDMCMNRITEDEHDSLIYGETVCSTLQLYHDENHIMPDYYLGSDWVKEHEDEVPNPNIVMTVQTFIASCTGLSCMEGCVMDIEEDEVDMDYFTTFLDDLEVGELDPRNAVILGLKDFYYDLDEDKIRDLLEQAVKENEFNVMFREYIDYTD